MVCEPGKVGRFLVVTADGDFSFEQLPVSLSDLMLRVEIVNKNYNSRWESF